MNAYIVSWKVEVEATSPEAAAELAYIAMQDYPRGTKIIFEVTEYDDSQKDAAAKARWPLAIAVDVDDKTGIASVRQ